MSAKWCGVAVGAGDGGVGPGGGMEADGLTAGVKRQAGRWNRRKERAPRAIRCGLCL